MSSSDAAGLPLSVYLVTDTVLCATYGVAATVEAAVRAGVTVVQLRDPAASDDDFVALGKEIAAVLRGTGVPLIVNDRAHLMEPIGAQGVHVGQRDLPVPQVRQIVGPWAIVGLSTQTVEHLQQARDFADQLDYVGIGPVFAQNTKPDAAQPCGMAGLAQLVAASAWPAVAIGGLKPEHAHLVKQAGAQGICVVSAICGQPDPSAAATALVKAWNQS